MDLLLILGPTIIGIRAVNMFENICYEKLLGPEVKLVLSTAILEQDQWLPNKFCNPYVVYKVRLCLDIMSKFVFLKKLNTSVTVNMVTNVNGICYDNKTGLQPVSRPVELVHYCGG